MKHGKDILPTKFKTDGNALYPEKYHKNFLTLLFGGEYQYGFTSTQTFGNNLGVPDTLQFNDQIGATQYNIFLQTDISLAEDFILNAGISYNNYRYDFTRLNRLPVKEINKTYDPVFVPDGADRTFAEMTLEEKNRYSHRRKAIDQLVLFLNNTEQKGQEI